MKNNNRKSLRIVIIIVTVFLIGGAIAAQLQDAGVKHVRTVINWNNLKGPDDNVYN